MNATPLNQAKDHDFHHIETAFHRAAQAARDIARQTNTPLIVVRDGKLLEIWVENIETMPRQR